MQEKCTVLLECLELEDEIIWYTIKERKGGHKMNHRIRAEPKKPLRLMVQYGMAKNFSI